MVKTARRGWFLWLCLLSTGCIQKLDPESYVRDLRILGIRAEPAELVDDPLPDSVRLEALVLDPRLEDPFAVEIEWQFCPVQSELFCRDFADLAGDVAGGFSLAEPSPGGGAPTIPGYPDCPASNETLAGLAGAGGVFAAMAEPDYLERYREVVTGDTYSLEVGGALQSVDLAFLSSIRDDLMACGEPPPSFALPQDTSSLHLYHFAKNPLESLLGVWPTVILRARASGEVLTAQKRLPVVFRHPANPLLLLRTLAPELDLGIVICPPGESSPGCLAVEAHPANRNPEFAAIKIRDGRDAGPGDFDTFWTPDDGPDPLLLEPRVVKVRESIRILPVFTEDSEEVFERFTVDPNTLEVKTIEAKEELSVGFFTTGGMLRDETTWVKGTIGLDSAVDALDETGLFRVYLVARDQRGGITWKGFRLEIVE